MSTYNGKCHCGQVEWSVKVPETEHILCNCKTCQSLGGGGFTLNQIIPRDNLKITKGELKAYAYKGDSGKSVNCYYCPNCTSHAYHHQEVMGPDTIVLRTILLDGGEKFTPAAEIYGKDRLPWQKEVATTHSTLPPQ